MIDKYKVLNNEEIQFDKYDEVKTDNEKMKNIIKSKLKSRKQRNKKLIVASISTTIVLGSIALTNETTLAYMDVLVSHIEAFLGRDYSEFDKYKFEGNQTIKDNGLVLNLGDVMLDDRQLIVSLGVDYSNFDFNKYGINKKDFSPNIPSITIGDMSFSGQGGMINERDVKGEDKKEFLISVNLTSIDTDGDGLVDTDFEILNNLKENKDYDVKIQFKDFNIGESNTQEGRMLSESFGNWEFNTTINSSNISNNVKVIKVDKAINISEGDMNYKIKFDEVRVSPVSVKIKVEGDMLDAIYSPTLLIRDEKGRNLDGGGTGNSEGTAIYQEYELRGTEKKITITPVVYSQAKGKYIKLENENVEIDIP